MFDNEKTSELEKDPETHFEPLSTRPHAADIAGCGTQPPAMPSAATVRPTVDPTARRRAAEKHRELKTKIDALVAYELGKQGNGYADLRASVVLSVRPKPREGASKVMDEIIGRLLTRQGAQQTQAAIRADIAMRFPQHPMPKDWTRPLPKWAVGKLQARLRCQIAPFDTLRVSRGLTLAQLHTKAKAAVMKAQTGAVAYSASVTIGSSEVLINGVPFKITSNKVKSNKGTEKSYRMVRLNIDTLTNALGTPT